MKHGETTRGRAAFKKDEQSKIITKNEDHTENSPKDKRHYQNQQKGNRRQD